MPLREQVRVGLEPADRQPVGATGSASTGLAERVRRAVAGTSHAVAEAWTALASSAAARDPEARELIGLLAAQEGGKQLRARLAIAAYLGMGGDDPGVCDALGSAVQLLHVGLCVHDDLIDGDDRRHGRPNVAGSVRAAWVAAGAPGEVADRQADAAALLAGDLAIGASLRAVVTAPVPTGIRTALALEVLSALDAAIAGELMDVRSEQVAPSAARPVRIAELKTAGYSVILPLRLGAVASGRAGSEVLDALAEYGRNLGIAYQLRDDELAVFGDPDRTGKSTSSDVRGGKRTRLLQLALRLASPADRAVLEREVGRADVSEEGVDRVRRIMRESGALERHRALIVRHAAEAVAALDPPAVPADLAAYLGVVARGVPARES
ncbi:polyprenyl synthetase family protein [Agromyces aurantiacus]|uniref:Polyprenyl synthetase family protein n=1 Tax=Agromyces aurantiacus TaxID=165814 RepID=A0ABV9R8T3_9MICO|nr:polyprenyl synthetase family protein [Agromyces aurantiacus]MBM7503440.1 geranylgeranyl pyrophosphate synthase [Agromyces aurantiacus]